MNLTMNDLKVGAVVVGRNNKIGIVIGHELNRPKNPILYKNSPDGASYIANPDWFKAVLGMADMDVFNKMVEEASKPLFPNVSPVGPLFGRDENDWMAPANIKAMKLKAGDQIQVKHGSRMVVATFGGFNWNRPKYPVSYEINGKKWKGPIDVVVGKAKQTIAIQTF